MDVPIQFPLFETPPKWQCPEFVDLSHARYIGFDVETYDPHLQTLGPGAVRGDGRLVGVSLATEDGWTGYFPIGHEVGFNLEPATVFNYLREQLSRPHQVKVGANVLYDLEWLAVNGVRSHGTLFDVQLAEALIDENQLSFSLENLAQKYLGVGKEERELERAALNWYGGRAKAKEVLWKLPAPHVGPYAERDASHPLNIMLQQWPQLEAEGLERVLNLEHRLIYLLLEMRLNGVRVDLERAEQVAHQLDEQQQTAQRELDEYVGAKGVNVWSQEHLQRAFDACGVQYPYTEKGSPSFTKTWLEDQEHPLAQKVVAVRSLDRSRKTYIEDVILKNNVNGRIYTQFLPLRKDDGGTVTGRLASKTPNLQQVPARDPVLAPLVRSCFIPEEGCDWESDDYCLTGDTLLVTDEGHRRIDQVAVGDRVLSSANGNDVSMQAVTASQRVGRNVPVYKITLDDGSTVKCTAYHKWMLYDGTFIETQELTGKEKLAHVKSGTAGPGGYPTWYLKSAFNYTYKHHLTIRGQRPKDHHVDHIDGDVTNWSTFNLRWLPASQNYGQGGQRYWQEVKSGVRTDENRLHALRKGLKTRRSYLGEGNPNFGKRKGKNRDCRHCGKSVYVPPRNVENTNIYCSPRCYHEARRVNNHRVKSIEYVGRDDVYHITVDQTHTFVLANGLVSSNSQIEPRVAVHFAYKAGAPGAQSALDAYVNDSSTDFHQLTADITGLERKPAKTINLALMYGMGLNKLAQDLGVVMDEAANIKKTYATRMPFIQQHAKRVNQWAERHGYIQTLTGRRRHFNLWVPADFSVGKKPLPKEQAMQAYEPPIQRFKAHTAYNGLVQGSAADVMKTAMLLLFESGIYDEIPMMHLTVHDETDHSIPRDKRWVRREIRHIMQTKVAEELGLNVPLKVDQEVGPNWGSVEETED